MQNKRNFYPPLYFLKQGKNYILVGMDAVGGADGSGDRVNLSLFNEFNNLIRVGQRNIRQPARDFFMRTGNRPNLSLHPDALSAGYFNYLAGQFDIFV